MTTNSEAMLIAVAGFAQSIVTLLTFGFYRPAWEFGVVVWLMRRKFPDDGEE